MQTQVAIVGAGPAGLAAALTLSRSMVNMVVLDAPQPARNAASPFVAALPGLDHRAPSYVRAAARQDIEAYGYADFLSEGVVDIQKAANGFILTLENDTTLAADVILLATGMLDSLPDLDGLEVLWGNSVINCPFCHGYEWKDRKWGIYAHRPEVIDAAEIYLNWTSDLTYFLAPDILLPNDREQVLLEKGIKLVRQLPQALSGTNNTLSHAHLPDGQQVALDCMLIFPRQKQVELVSRLGLELTDAGNVAIDDGYRTSLKNIYAAGDLTYSGHQNTPTAFHMGNMAAATIVMDLCFAS